MTSKTCTRCREVKPLTEYHRDKNRKDGRVWRCKACVKAYQAEYIARPEVKERRVEYTAEYQARPEVKARRDEYRVEHHAEHPGLWWESYYRQRAKQYGFSHLIPSMQSFTREDLIWLHGDKCYHCGGEWTELDHWPIPISRGGMHALFNAVPSCADCNQRSWRTAPTNNTTITEDRN